MILIDGIKAPRAAIWRVADYLLSGLSGLGVICLAIALWQLGSQIFGEFLLPSPKVVFVRAYEILANYKSSDIPVTLFRAVVGVGVSCAIGITLGLIAGYYKSFAAFLKPFITILLSMPPIIWVVLALFWFSFGNVSTIFTIIITSIPLTFASSMVGMMSVNEQLKEMFDAYDLGILKKIRHLYLPHLTSYIISSLSVAVGMGVKIVIMAELLGASDGVGSKIADARVMLDTPSVMAYVVLIITLVMLFEYLIIEPLKILLMPWKR
ncbi:ABC transporter permease [Campylobacter curvus]|uniref:ABC transporter permease n=1 Tax=Campylobacter curvus TaxID=200 RepID=UPI00146FE0D0|nr:ABC transporter permease subunit [Campylobacter curvus]